jgi:hypothetical protein
MSLTSRFRKALGSIGAGFRAHRKHAVFLTSLALIAVALSGAASAPRAASPTTVTPRINLRVLLVSMSSTNADLPAWQTALQREGIPYDAVYPSATSPITPATLSSTDSDGTPHGKYEAIIVTTSGTLDPASQTAVEQYEAAFNVRQVTGDVYPSATYGLNTPPPAGNGLAFDGLSGSLTADGQKVFSYLKPTAPITMATNTWGYEATPISATNFDTLVTLGSNPAYSIVGIYTHPDGVQELVETFNQNQYMLQAFLLRHGVLAWATRDVFFGDQRNYLETDIDDVLNSDDVWSTSAHANSGTVAMTATDVANAVSWSQANSFRMDNVFNGGGDQAGTLAPTYKADANDFGWINHTLDHPNIDEGCATAPYIESEITGNITWAQTNLGLTPTTDASAQSPSINQGAVVTGEHSGIANLLPGNPGTIDPPVLATALPATTTGDSLAAGSYVYAVADQFTNSTTAGQSTPSESATIAVGTGQNSVTLTWPAVCHAADYVIYRGVVGSTGTTWTKIASYAPTTWIVPGTNQTATTAFGDTGANDVTFTDNGTPANTGTDTLPTSNTAVEGPYQQNPNLITAFATVGITAFGADASKPYPNPANASFSDYLAGQTYTGTEYPAGATFAEPAPSGAQAVPRYPTNIYYNVSTQAEEVDEFNTIMMPPTCKVGCISAAWTFPQIVNDVVNGAGMVGTVLTPSTVPSGGAMFENVMDNDPRPHFFHQSNLTGDGLYYSVMNQLLSEYNTYFSVPLAQSTMGQIAQLLGEQAAWSTNTLVSGYIQGNQVTITNSGAATSVPLSGIATVGSAYGGTQSGWSALSSGTSVYPSLVTWPASRKVALALSPASIVANGNSTSTATVTVTNSDGFPITGDTVTLAADDPAVKVGTVTDQKNGTYTATVTSSTTVHTVTLTAADTLTVANTTPLISIPASTNQALTQTLGVAASVGVQLSPASLVADGSSTSLATATVKDAQGRSLYGEHVTFSSSDGAVGIGSVTDRGDGTYTATITSSTTAGAVTIKATDTSVSPNVVGQATLTQTPRSAPSPPVQQQGTSSPPVQPAPPTMDTTGPVMILGTGTLAKQGNRVPITLTCPSGHTYCDGTVTLTKRGNGRKAMTLGQSHFHISGGSKAIVNITLSKATLTKLGKATTVPVAISATAQNKAGRQGTARRTTTLWLVLDKTPPSVGIGAGPLVAVTGKVPVKLSCPSSQSYCDGTATLSTVMNGHTLVLGKARFHVIRETTGTVTVTLTKSALQQLGKVKSVRVAVDVSALNRAGRKGTSHRVLTLTLS